MLVSNITLQRSTNFVKQRKYLNDILEFELQELILFKNVYSDNK